MSISKNINDLNEVKEKFSEINEPKLIRKQNMQVTKKSFQDFNFF